MHTNNNNKQTNKQKHYLVIFGSECPLQCPDMLWLIICAYTSLDGVSYYVSLWRFVVVFVYIVNDFRCIFPSLDPCFSVSHFLSEYLCCLRLYCHWLYVKRYVSWSAFLFRSVCLGVWYIIGNSTCIPTSLDPYFSLSLSLNVCSSVRLCYNSL